jgi:hypothetical protein
LKLTAAGAFLEACRVFRFVAGAFRMDHDFPRFQFPEDKRFMLLPQTKRTKIVRLEQIF